MVNLEARLKRGQNELLFLVCVRVRALVCAHVHTEASMSDLLFLSLPYSLKRVLLAMLEACNSQ